MPSFSMSRALEHLDAELELARELLRLVGEIGRACRCWAAGCRACARDRCRPRSRPRPRRSACACSVGRAPSGRTTSLERARARRLLLRLQLVEAVERVAQAEHGVAHVPGQAAAADRELRRRGSAASFAPRSLQRGGGAAHRVAERGDAVLARSPSRRAGRARRRGRQRRAAAASSRPCPAGRPGERLAQRAARGLVGGRAARVERLAAPLKTPSTRQPASPSRARASVMLNSTGFLP